MKLIELTLKLFNSVPKGEPAEYDLKTGLKHGIVIAENAVYAKDDIFDYFEKSKLSGEQLNATFHKSWEVIKNSSREELLLHQILHYITTYGTNFTSDFIYLPAEKLELPKIKTLAIKVIRGVEKSELIKKSLNILSSGIALDENTIDELLELLQLLGHSFKSVDNIKNKEAAIKIIAKVGVYPSKPVEFLRYLVYLATDSTLLIKNKKTILEIKEKKINITAHLNNFGLVKCAAIFNRFKPLWLAFKSNKDNAPFINKISSLSKTHHQAMPVDVLNTITSIVYSEQQIKKALEGVNNFRKIRLLNALNTRINGADVFLYRIRNGKSFTKKNKLSQELDYYKKTLDIVYQNLVESLDVKDKKIKYPTNIDYALPSSEKMFVGNIPAGTKITAKKLVSGIYWESQWGAKDLDLSALSLEGKVGWNSKYKGKGLLYSGDITNATSGASELLYTSGKLKSPALSLNNIFSGSLKCKFKIIIGSAPKVTKNYMLNPNELILEVKTEMIQKQQILGIFLPEENDKISFIVVNVGLGNISVSAASVNSNNARAALFYQYVKPISLKQLLSDAGAIIVNDENHDIDLMPSSLQKDSLLKLFN